jgi:hypothetical protein
VSHQKEAIEPSYPIQQDQDHANHPQVLLGHVSGPLTNSYQMELGPPLGIPVSNSLETSCSSPTEDSMVWTPLPPCGEATKRRIITKVKAPIDRPLAPSEGSRAAL